MKKRHHQDSCSSSYGGAGSSSSAGKAKAWEEEQDPTGGMDELLAVLGYKVRSSDMADVALKLEQLEMVMGQEDSVSFSHLQNDTVHYNPSDLSSWVQTMLSELNAPIPDQVQPLHTDLDFSGLQNRFGASESTQPQLGFSDDSEYDLSAIPGVAAYPPPPPPPQRPAPQQLQQQPEPARGKRMKTSIGPSNPNLNLSSSSSSSSSAVGAPESTRPVVLVDSQEAGVRLVHTLMACAEAVQQENLKLAEELVKYVGLLAVSQAGAMRKVATCFAEALARRIYKIYPQDSLDATSYNDILEMHFYETCPYLKFAHFTANQAILEAFGTASRVHVIDFSLKQGMQWPALMQALALRPGGPPAFRLTGIGPPQPDNTDALQQIGWKLAQLAETIGVEFEFRGYVATSLADLEPAMLDLRPPEVEAVAVNSVFELHRLLARPGAIEKVLNSIEAMKPKIITIVEQEANHNGPVFLDRFTEALHYYSSLFDSLEGSGRTLENQDLVMSDVYLGRQICNVVACEGPDRFERHETLAQWRSRMGSAGFDPVPLGSNAFKQAGMLLDLFSGGEGYRVEENNGCLMLGWHTRPLIATSAWRLAPTVAPTGAQ
ncbi:hypothetical protein CDL15_Pgr027772 [Punica granatum]|uniref:DELLA protein n=1 Tax=Punica granatum TaxID=22663 RepID=A0A218XIE6_PUNGR|nr:hypothetical protein CDL15_Pgr027772 [Punica granatum]